MRQLIPTPMVELARLTLLEARRTAVAKSMIAAIGLALGLALFMEHIVLTEQARAAVVVYVVVVRLSLVLLIAQAIIANTVRDLHERVVEHFLALPLTRLQYAAGKWLGWAAVAAVSALAAGLPLIGFAGTLGWLAWTLSFAVETVVVAGVALLLALSLGRVVTAMLAFCCLYLFARIGYLLLLLGQNMGASEGSPVERFDLYYVQIASYLLPRMDRFAETGWLTGGAIHVGPGLLQGAIYLALLGAVANLELRRKQL